MNHVPTRRLTAVIAVVAQAAVLTSGAQTPSATPTAARTDPYTDKQRVIVMTDIANEPDDQMSMVRFLVYSNQFDVEGLIATTEEMIDACSVKRNGDADMDQPHRDCCCDAHSDAQRLELSGFGPPRS